MHPHRASQSPPSVRTTSLHGCTPAGPDPHGHPPGNRTPRPAESTRGRRPKRITYPLRGVTPLRQGAATSHPPTTTAKRQPATTCPAGRRPLSPVRTPLSPALFIARGRGWGRVRVGVAGLHHAAGSAGAVGPCPRSRRSPCGELLLPDRWPRLRRGRRCQVRPGRPAAPLRRVGAVSWRFCHRLCESRAPCSATLPRVGGGSPLSVVARIPREISELPRPQLVALPTALWRRENLVSAATRSAWVGSPVRGGVEASAGTPARPAPSASEADAV